MEILSVFIFLCLIFGSLTGYLAYFLTSLIEKIDFPNMRPWGLMAYLAFITIAVMSIEGHGSFVFIVAGVFIGCLTVGVAMRGNSTNVLDRLVFFGCALFMSPFLAILSLFLLIMAYELGCSVLGVRSFQLEDAETGELFVTYIAFTMLCVFAAPLIENLFRFAVSMRIKTD